MNPLYDGVDELGWLGLLVIAILAILAGAMLWV